MSAKKATTGNLVTRSNTPTRKRRPQVKRGERPAWAKAFLELLRQRPVITYAANEVGVARKVAYDLFHRDPVFAEEWNEALADGAERLEAKAFERIDKAEDPSNNLLIFMLKGHHPSKYRERYEVNSSLAMSAVQGWKDRVLGAVLKSVKDPETLDRLQAEFEEIDKA